MMNELRGDFDMRYRNLTVVIGLVGLLFSVSLLEATGTIRVLEAENSNGQGLTIMQRSNASEQHTVHVDSGESIRQPFRVAAGRYQLSVRYSNDNAPTQGETVKLYIDGAFIASFVARDTGSGGSGWNIFVTNRWNATPRLSRGLHTLRVSVSGGDGFGIELDKITIRPAV
jgi:hypothetical protein